jgi:beta-barrel assembly-enhancing protease
MTRAIRWRLLATVFVAALFVGCDDSGDINLFTEADDAKLGEDVAAEIEADPANYPPYDGDPAVATYVEGVFQNVLASPEVERKEAFDYEITLIGDAETLNAFALPGGKIYVYEGLLKYLDSEAALAGVIAHEVAHCEKRHATQRMTAYYGVSALLSLLLGNSPSMLTEIAANLFVNVAFLANSRSDEDQADEYSYIYMNDTKYYPGGVKFFFEKMRDDGLVDEGGQGVATFLSTHPDPIDRIATTNERLRENGVTVVEHDATGNNLYKSDYKTNVLDKL